MLEEASDGAERVSYEAWLDAKFPRGRSTASRLCGNTDLLKQHIRSFEKAGKLWETLLLEMHSLSRSSKNVFGRQQGEKQSVLFL